MAQISSAKGHFQQGLKDIKAINLSELPSWIPEKDICFLEAKCLEKVGDYEQAFASYSKGAELVKAQSNNNLDYLPAFKKLNLESLARADKSPRESSTPSEFPEVVFMASFPRSGTTLLDSFLSADDKIDVVSEIGALGATINEMEKVMGLSYPSDIGRLSNKQIVELRSIYFEYIENYLGILPDGIIVDKMPIASLHVPFINLLFPQVKVIFPLRHPLDVVLSNFQQDFQLNPEMSHLITLKQCFSRYNEIMGLYLTYKEKLDFVESQVKYEDLVSNPKQVLDKLYADLGLGEYPFENPDHRKALDKKYVKTSSREQVKQGIYLTSVQKWKNYSKYIEKEIPLLAPLIRNFGYEVV